jgi:hypothetical protein
MASKKSSRHERTSLGKLPRAYKFFLNPYRDARFTKCPICEAKMHSRKLPFLVHVDPAHPVVLNMTAAYCPADELLILHQDKLENLLAATFATRAPEVLGNRYLVVGTLERDAARRAARGEFTLGEVFDHLHDFKEHLKFEPVHYGWVYTGPPKDKQ